MIYKRCIQGKCLKSFILLWTVVFMLQSFSFTAQSADNETMYFAVSILLDGLGENRTTIDEMNKMRSQLLSIESEIHVTWAMTTDYVFSEDNRREIAYVLSMVEQYGDEIGIAYGFPNNNETLDSFVDKMEEWLYMYRYNAYNDYHVNGTQGDVSVYQSLINNNLVIPTSMTSYAINNEQLSWLRNNYNIDSCMGWAATQTNVDQLTGEGSPLMPYLSHINNPLVPTMNESTSSDVLFFNCITVNPVGSTYTEGESRWTIHPADPLNDGVAQLHTVNQYLNNPYRKNNTVNYLSLLVDINWMLRDQNLSTSWDNIIAGFPKDEVEVVGLQEFNQIARSQIAPDNSNNEFIIEFTGSGENVRGYYDDEKLTYLWIESNTERIILKTVEGNDDWTIIDFTNYRGEIPKLPYTTRGNEEDVSYITGRNFKLAPTAPLKTGEKMITKLRLEEIDFKGFIGELDGVVVDNEIIALVNNEAIESEPLLDLVNQTHTTNQNNNSKQIIMSGTEEFLDEPTSANLNVTEVLIQRMNTTITLFTALIIIVGVLLLIVLPTLALMQYTKARKELQTITQTLQTIVETQNSLTLDKQKSTKSDPNS